MKIIEHMMGSVMRWQPSFIVVPGMIAFTLVFGLIELGKYIASKAFWLHLYVVVSALVFMSGFMPLLFESYRESSLWLMIGGLAALALTAVPLSWLGIRIVYSLFLKPKK